MFAMLPPASSGVGVLGGGGVLTLMWLVNFLR